MRPAPRRLGRPTDATPRPGWLVFQIQTLMWLCRLTIIVPSVASCHLQQVSCGNYQPLALHSSRHESRLFFSYSSSSSAFHPVWAVYSLRKLLYTFLIPAILQTHCLSVWTMLLDYVYDLAERPPVACASANTVVQTAWCIIFVLKPVICLRKDS
jgi:hypothetical protein